MIMRLAGYELKESLHQGRSCRVSRAIRQADGQPVVVKLLTGDPPSAAELARFRREFEVARTVSGGTVIRVDAFAPVDNTAMIVMEDVGGVGLDELLRSRTFSLKRALRVAAEVAAGLARAHERGVIHKNINPGNIVVSNDGTVRIIDFAVAATVGYDVADLAPPQRLEGSLPYLAPEQTGRVNRVVDPRSDLYALGATLYELLVGQPPFAGTDPVELIEAHLNRTVVAPSAVRADLPSSVDELILRLLAKEPGDRYQTAQAVEHDLRLCAAGVDASSGPATSARAARDVPHQLSWAGKLYGRGQELARLTAAFHRAAEGTQQGVLVGGDEGTGASSLVRELLRPIALRGGLFGHGTFDQYRPGGPYAGFAQAIRAIVDQLVSARPEVVASARRRIGEVVGEHGWMITAIVPEVELLLGKQPPSPGDGTARRHEVRRVMRDFVLALGTRAQPVVLFIDDLQWADPASLQLFPWVCRAGAASYVLVVGAYRDHEPRGEPPGYPARTQGITAHPTTERIHLGPLARAHVMAMLADWLGLDPDEVAPLADLCLDKTGGNPLAISELLRLASGRGLIGFSATERAWRWDDQLRSFDLAADLGQAVANELRDLPVRQRELLKLCACMGGRIDLDELARAAGASPAEVAADMLEVVRRRYVIPVDTRYKYADPAGAPAAAYAFRHDLIQRAAHQCLDEAEAASIQRRLATVLIEGVTAPETSTRVFEMVGCRNLGALAAQDPTQWQRWSGIYLAAARRALALGAFSTAVDCFVAVLRSADDGRGSHDGGLLAEAADAALLAQRFAELKELAQTLRTAARSPLQRAAAESLLARGQVASGQPARAIAQANHAMAALGIQLPRRLTRWHAVGWLLRTRLTLAGKTAEHLLRAARLRDEHLRAAGHILAEVFGSVTASDPLQLTAAACIQLSIALQHGVSAEACPAFALYGAALAVGLHDYQEGRRMGQLALTLAGALGARRQMPRVRMVIDRYLAHCGATSRPVLDDVQANYRRACEVGDIEAACLSLSTAVHAGLVGGMPLPELAAAGESYLQIACDHGHQLAVDEIAPFVQLFHQLAHGPASAALRGEYCDEQAPLRDNRGHAHQLALYCLGTCQLTLAVIHGDIAAAQAAARRCGEHQAAAMGLALVPYVHLLGSVAAAMQLQTKSRREQRAAASRLDRSVKQFRRWASADPGKRGQLFLLEAERAGLAGELEQAQAGYARAIARFRESRLIHLEAIAQERLAATWSAQDERDYAALHLENARYAYERWGASSKAAQLAEHNQHWVGAAARPAAAAGPRPLAVVVESEVEAVAAAAQALSGLTSSDETCRQVVDLALAHSGAGCGAVVLATANTQTVAAYREQDRAGKNDDGPEEFAARRWVRPLARAVLESGDELVVGGSGALAENRGASLTNLGVASAWAVPMVHLGDYLGAVCLADRANPDRFSPDSTRVLKSLAAQAAISLANARYLIEVREKAALEGEVRAARAVQDAMRPGPIAVPSVRLSTWAFEDARSGGSWCDYSFDPQHRLLYLHLANIRGSGVVTALVNGLAAGAIKASQALLRSTQAISPGDAVHRMFSSANRAVRLPGGQASHSLTMAMVCVDVDSGAAAYINAGHEPLYLIGSGHVKPLGPTMPALGAQVDDQGTIELFEFQPGQQLVGWTGDNATPSAPASRSWSRDTVSRALRAGLDAEQIKDCLLAAAPAEESAIAREMFVSLRWCDEASDAHSPGS
jgi:histidine kinase